MSELKEVIAQCGAGGKYKPTEPQEWKRNVAKKKRVSGESYTSQATGKIIAAKTFTVIKACCAKKCYSGFDRDCQKEMFSFFYETQTKESQDQYLASALEKFLSPVRARVNLNPKKVRLHIWKYYLNMKGKRTEVCRGFFMMLLQVTSKRLRVIQSKLLDGESFREKRGTHGNQKKLQEGVYKLALQHLQTIPNRSSHYSSKRSNRQYFDNPNLTVKQIFEEFQKYYLEQTGGPLHMSKKTYYNFYSQTNFAIKKPKTDTCDFCCESERKLQKNPNDRTTQVELEVHKRRARKHDEVKKQYIQDAKDSQELLVIEFDYAQNLPLPKLTICKQFYKRLIWLYLFNIHCHNDGTSFMYTFLESTAKKGPNSVASFLFDFFQKKISSFPNLKKIVMLSDAAGGQNKNNTMMKFCAYIGSIFSVNVLQFFPIRGHSFGQCDRNFGQIRSKLKGLEVIETPDPYFQAILSAREHPAPFVHVNDSTIMFEWDKTLAPFFEKNPTTKGVKFGIQKYCQLMYSSTGTNIAASKSYDLDAFQPFRFMKTKPVQIDLQPSCKVPFKVGRKGEGKVKDVEDLYCYLQEASVEFVKRLFESVADQPPTSGEIVNNVKANQENFEERANNENDENLIPDSDIEDCED